MDTLYSEKQHRIVLLVEYDGAAFSGCQAQAGPKTVQQTLETAFTTLGIRRLGRVVFSGRTDAGVHAKGQVAHVDVQYEDLQRFPELAKSLNAVLPATLSIRAVELNPNSGFHALSSAQYRWYRYVIFNRKERSVWMPPASCWISKPLNAGRMNEAAQLLLGEQNFKSFKCPDTAIMNDICHVIHAQVHRQEDLIIFDIVANRFLYKMVRNLLGFLVEVGLESSRYTPKSLQEVLAQQDRTQAGPAAKSRGLSFMAVAYPPEHRYFAQDVHVQWLNQQIMESMQNENLFRKAS